MSQITEKQTALSEDLGRDANSVKGLQRKHHNFERDLLTLAKQVQTVQEEAAKLQAAYAGDKAKEITDREAEVVEAWLAVQRNWLHLQPIFEFYKHYELSAISQYKTISDKT